MICVISGFRSAEVEGSHLALVGNFLPTIRCSLWVPFEGSWTARPLQVGFTDCPERTVTDYEPILHDIPEERRPRTNDLLSPCASSSCFLVSSILMPQAWKQWILRFSKYRLTVICTLCLCPYVQYFIFRPITTCRCWSRYTKSLKLAVPACPLVKAQ